MRLPRWLSAGLLLGLGIASYSNTGHVPFVFDDQGSIESNGTIRSPSLRALMPPRENTMAGRPVANVTFALNAAFSGLSLPPMHWTNLALHLIAGLLLLTLVRRTLLLPRFGDAYERSAEVLALFAALLWVLHPVQTESVTYLSQRVESLAGLFLLLMLHAALSAHEARRPFAWSAAAVLFCGLGMGAKETMAVAPIVAVLYDRAFLFPSMGEALRKRGRLWAGLAGTWLVLGLLVATSPRRRSAGFHFPDFTPRHYLGIQAGAVARYLRLLLVPVGLVFDYGEPAQGVPLAHSIRDWGPPAALVLALVALSVWAWLRKPEVGFLAVGFFVLLAPSSSVIPIITELISEHRLYLPSAATLILLVMGVYHLALRRRALTAAAAAGVAAVLCLAVLTWRRNAVYRTRVSLWEDTTAKRPENPRAWKELGMAEELLGNLAEAARAFREQVRTSRAGYEEELRHDPRYPLALKKLGLLDEAQFDRFHDAAALEQAVELEGRYLERRPGDATMQSAYARVQEKRGRLGEALAHHRTAMELAPHDAAIAEDAANCLARAGNEGEAMAAYRTALALRPGWALGHYNLAVFLVRKGRYDAALDEFHTAQHLDAKVVAAWRRGGLVAAWVGRPDEAVRDLEQAIRLEPDPAIKMDLAWLLSTHPDVRVRDGHRALALALEAAASRETARSLDVLAAAQAENGAFDLAQKSLARALSLATDGAARDALASRMASYRRHEPWREQPSPDG